jgi:hypothetical protein
VQFEQPLALPPAFEAWRPAFEDEENLSGDFPSRASAALTAFDEIDKTTPILLCSAFHLASAG